MHPAIVAQAAATLEVMYPGRSWLGLGSGEALNEHVVAGYWPEAPERINRMFEAIEIISKLFSGKDVKHDGRFFKMETCRLWTLPQKGPPIYVATAGPVTARRTGRTCPLSAAARPCASWSMAAFHGFTHGASGLKSITFAVASIASAGGEAAGVESARPGGAGGIEQQVRHGG